MSFTNPQKIIVNPTALAMENDYGFEFDKSMVILLKAYEGGEFNNVSDCEDWYNNRFSESLVKIDEDEYAKMCIDALKTVQYTVASDFGGARQRDLGQLWGDMIRGYLGEIAFKKFLNNKWGIESKLAHQKGKLKDFLDTDIAIVKLPGQDWRKPYKNIGIKTTKMRGVWFDIPGDQFNHSDFHVLVKVGVERDHLFGFFKKISVFKDKILRLGQDIGALDGDESDLIFDKLPNLKPINAYISGFVNTKDSFSELPYKGKMGRIHYKVTAWNGPYYPEDIEKIKHKENLTARGKVEFLGIGSFTNQSRFLFNTGSLKWEKEHWESFVNSL